jgi:hypothetical protein
VSTFVQFVPSTTAAFTFQPVLAGVTYNATVTWNTFSQRYYLNLYDQNSNLIVCRPVSSSGPRFQATLTWDNGFAQAALSAPHNVPVGSVATVRVSETGTAFDGDWQALAGSAQGMTYLLPNPDLVNPVTGTLQQPLNLVGGYNIGWLLFHWDLQQFEFAS